MQNLNDKHIEVVVKQLFSKVFIQDSGNSSFIPGTRVKFEHFLKVNEDLISQGKRPARGLRLALGLTNIAKETDSWLSSASFQETIRVMVGASLRGAIDDLSDLKANVYMHVAGGVAQSNQSLSFTFGTGQLMSEDTIATSKKVFEKTSGIGTVGTLTANDVKLRVHIDAAQDIDQYRGIITIGVPTLQ